jgi:hypothetical protein
VYKGFSFRGLVGSHTLSRSPGREPPGGLGFGGGVVKRDSQADENEIYAYAAYG